MDDLQQGQIDRTLADYMLLKPPADKTKVKEELREIVEDWAQDLKREALNYIEAVVENAYAYIV